MAAVWYVFCFSISAETFGDVHEGHPMRYVKHLLAGTMVAGVCRRPPGTRCANGLCPASGTAIFGFDGDGICIFISCAANPNDTTGYGGNDAFFTNIAADLRSGDTAIANGSSDSSRLKDRFYRSLERLSRLPWPYSASALLAWQALAAGASATIVQTCFSLSGAAADATLRFSLLQFVATRQRV